MINYFCRGRYQAKHIFLVWGVGFLHIVGIFFRSIHRAQQDNQKMDPVRKHREMQGLQRQNKTKQKTWAKQERKRRDDRCISTQISF